MTVPLSILVFHDLDTFEEYLPINYFVACSAIGICLKFSLDHIEVIHCYEEYNRGDVCPSLGTY